jgi:hypothetical protein
MISHYNVLAHIMQVTAQEAKYRESLKLPGQQSPYTGIVLGLLPQSHIYSIGFICHAGTYRGDQIIVLPKFELGQYLNVIQKFQITILFLVGARTLIESPQRVTDCCHSRYHLSSSECCETVIFVQHTT